MTQIETEQNSNTQDRVRRNELLWFAGAVGTAVGVAVWAYSRRELTYWERTKRTAGQVGEKAAEMEPWLGIAAGTAAVGCAVLAFSRREPKSAWQKAGENAGEIFSQTTKQVRPWLRLIADTAASVASTAYNAKTRKRASAIIEKQAANAADHFADAGTRLRHRLQTMS